MKTYALYRVPFTGSIIRVEVLGLAVRNGIEKVHILLPDVGWDLWVPEKHVF